MQMLKKIRVSGWKSIREASLDLTPLTVIVGANGAGKSNLLSLFELLNALFANSPSFRTFVGQSGFSNSLLHNGTRQTSVAEIELTFLTETGETSYLARWVAAASGSLIFDDEQVKFLRRGSPTPQIIQLGAGQTESNLPQLADSGNNTAAVTLKLLRNCRRFHFHDTSRLSAVRQPCSIEANRFLLPDSGNLAAMLYLFKQNHPATYIKITAAVRQAIPGFGDFLLEPSRLNPRQIQLNWTRSDLDCEFGPHQFSDGTLRFISLATLLFQPAESLPLLIALDEPELGLHPSALELLGGMLRSTALRCQIVCATQSSVLLNQFEPDNIVVVNERAGTSDFRRLGADELAEWLDDYTMGEVWEKNVFGGGPYG